MFYIPSSFWHTHKLHTHTHTRTHTHTHTRVCVCVCVVRARVFICGVTHTHTHTHTHTTHTQLHTHNRNQGLKNIWIIFDYNELLTNQTKRVLVNIFGSFRLRIKASSLYLFFKECPFLECHPNTNTSSMFMFSYDIEIIRIVYQKPFLSDFWVG